jgi:RES domain-containing protein
MLEECEPAQVGMIVYRFANLSYESDFLRNRKTLSDNQVLRVLAFRGRRRSIDLMKVPFRKKRLLEGRYGRETRYSDGTWPTFYSALSEATARKEAGHHHAKCAVQAGGEAMPVYYSRVACKFQGSHINLWPKLGEWDLVSESYEFCHGLGKEAHLGGLGAFWTPSARDRPEGSCIPVFVEGTIGDVVVTGTAKFEYDAEAEAFVVTMI